MKSHKAKRYSDYQNILYLKKALHEKELTEKFLKSQNKSILKTLIEKIKCWFKKLRKG